MSARWMRRVQRLEFTLLGRLVIFTALCLLSLTMVLIERSIR